VKAKVLIKHLGAFEQDVKVTTYEEHDVPIEAGDEVVVQMVAVVKAALVSDDGTVELDLRDVQPHKIVAVRRKKS
jgi:hypothetical protein